MTIVVRALIVCLFLVHFTAEAKSKKAKRALSPNEISQPAKAEAPPESTTTAAVTAAASPSPTPTPTPVEEKKDDKLKDFTRPLFFAVDDSSVKVAPPAISYEQTGSALKIGDFTFSNESLKAQIDQDVLVINWDTQLVPGGNLSIIDSYGKELWKTKVDSSGSFKFSQWNSTHSPQWKSGDRFRFCLRSEQGKGFASMCTQTYGVEISAEQKIKLDYTKSVSDSRVIVMNEERKKTKDQVPVAIDTPAQFLGTLQSGATYEFMSEPVPLYLKDFIESEQKNMVTFKGLLPAPISKDVKVIKGIEYGTVTKAFGFQKSIAEPQDLWQLDVPSKDAKLHLAGKSGGVFTYNLNIISFPKLTERLFVKAHSLNGTYKAKDKIQVKIPSDAQIEGLTSTDEKSQEPNLRTWEFSAENKYELNKPELLLKGEQATHHAYLEVYRGTSGEASLRLSDLATSSGQTALLGEAHISYWFNDLFGWQNDYLSKQRWGMSLKYFTTFQKLPANDGMGGTEDVNMNSTQFDVRYRLQQGLWGRDETVGLLGSYEALSIGDQKANKLGAGVFWARSMPKVFDDLMNKISWLNHPKYVDMEYIQFFGSTDSGTSVGSDFIINFHGKIMYAKNFFAEAGFGLKNYNFTKPDDTVVKLSTLYGTLGVGLEF
ncbi:MAG: hypothetical protein ACKOX6_13275 [Bdellovibrio sp.]